MCFSCGHTLSWTELIPIGSFLAQRGKCVTCRARISWQYPVVEWLTGIVFVTIFWMLEATLMSGDVPTFVILFVYYAVLFSVLIILAVYDILHKILPDLFVWLFALIAGIGMFFIDNSQIALHIPSLSSITAGLIIPAPFAFLWLVSKGKWMGFGDAKLAVGIGLLLGLSGGIAALFLAFWSGALYGVLHILWNRVHGRKHISLKSAIPFGPFLILGTAIVLFAHLDLVSLINTVQGLIS